MNDKLTFDEVPSSTVQPIGNIPFKFDFESATKPIIEYWQHVDTKYYQQYNKGSIMANNTITTLDPTYEKVVELLFNSIFQALRDDINDKFGESDLEEKQDMLKRVSAVESVFNSGVLCLKELNIKLDINSVLTILQGSVNQSTLKTTRQYETRQSIKH